MTLKAKSGSVLAIGVFDGLHKGHMKLLNTAKKLAGKNGFAVMTFNPHPTFVLKGKTQASKLIFSPQERVKKLQLIGANKIRLQKFDKNFANKSPENFIKFLKKLLPDLKYIVVGENFRFGKNASGNIDWLKANAERFGIVPVSVKGVKVGGQFASATRLRTALQNGDLKTFEKLANARYTACGVVEKGAQLGRKLGFATLNIKHAPQCMPKFGVYITKVLSQKSKKEYFAVSNYGVKPSVGNAKVPLIESHILGKTRLGYGSEIRVEFVKFLRGEKKFKNLDELKDAIAKDVCASKKYWKIK